jgi:ActR/RegA family two-component response regulator
LIPASLEVLIVEGEEPITAALASALDRRGHHVATARSAERALELPAPDVLVCEALLSGACGLDLLTAMQERGDRARAVLLLAHPTVEDCLRALQLGATALLTKPFRLADLIRAVEGGSRMVAPCAEEERGVFERSYPASPDSVERCARDLAAFALRLGIPPSARARIASAASEIVHNAHRHGRSRPGGRIRVRAQVDDRSLLLRIRDEGVGFDSSSARATPPPGPALKGLSRAMALSEAMSVETAAGTGTSVELRFCTTTAAFAEGQVDLSEADFLTPELARDVLSALMDGETPDVSGISPALAVVLGRLLAGPEPMSRSLGRSAMRDPLT